MKFKVIGNGDIQQTASLLICNELSLRYCNFCFGCIWPFLTTHRFSNRRL